LWISRLVLDAVHFDLLRAHGGMPGLRDENALESALARPRQRWAYRQETDLAGLAAAYGFGLARNHPYRDGNKRIAFLAMAVFLGLNDYEIEASERDVVTLMLTLAAGRITEAALARWLRARLVASDKTEPT
jgi:death-on-curing protein